MSNHEYLNNLWNAAATTADYQRQQFPLFSENTTERTGRNDTMVAGQKALPLVEHRNVCFEQPL